MIVAYIILNRVQETKYGNMEINYQIILLHVFSAGHHRNPQTEAFLQLLDLPYLIDDTSESRDMTSSPAPLISRGKYSFPFFGG